MKFIKIRSWHVLVETFDERKALCGRKVKPDAPVADEFPEDEKTCETCLRKAVK